MKMASHLRKALALRRNSKMPHPLGTGRRVWGRMKNWVTTSVRKTGRPVIFPNYRRCCTISPHSGTPLLCLSGVFQLPTIASGANQLPFMHTGASRLPPIPPHKTYRRFPHRTVSTHPGSTFRASLYFFSRSSLLTPPWAWRSPFPFNLPLSFVLPFSFGSSDLFSHSGFFSQGRLERLFAFNSSRWILLASSASVAVVIWWKSSGTNSCLWAML